MSDSDAALGGFDDVEKEHGDSHGADTAGDGADPGGGAGCGDLIEVDIPHCSGRALRGLDAVDADVDDDGAWLDHVALDERGDAGGGDEDVGFLGESGEIGGPLVATDDGGVLAHEHDGDGFADVVAGADNDGDLAAGLDAGVLDHLDDREGGAGSEAGPAVDDVADVGGVDALDVFFRSDEALDGVGVGRRREGQVDHDGGDFVLGIEEEDAAGDLVVAAGLREFVEDVFDADLAAGSGLAFGVLAGGIVGRADKDGVEMDPAAGGADGGGTLRDALPIGLGEGFAVDERGCHWG